MLLHHRRNFGWWWCRWLFLGFFLSLFSHKLKFDLVVMHSHNLEDFLFSGFALVVTKDTLWHYRSAGIRFRLIGFITLRLCIGLGRTLITLGRGCVRVHVLGV